MGNELTDDLKLQIFDYLSVEGISDPNNRHLEAIEAVVGSESKGHAITIIGMVQETIAKAYAAGQADQQEKDRQEIVSLFETLDAISNLDDPESLEMLNDLKGKYVPEPAVSNYKQDLAEAEKKGAKTAWKEILQLMDKQGSGATFWFKLQVQSKLKSLED